MTNLPVARIVSRLSDPEFRPDRPLSSTARTAIAATPTAHPTHTTTAAASRTAIKATTGSVTTHPERRTTDERNDTAPHS